MKPMSRRGTLLVFAERDSTGEKPLKVATHGSVSDLATCRP